MKKRTHSMIAAGLCLVFLAGCQETPKDTIVRQKGADSIKSYEGTEDTGDSLREVLGAPEHYKNKASYQEGGLIIDTDADVILPDAAAMNTYAVSAMEPDQELIDHITQAFFPDAKFYSAYSYDQWTKADYEKRLTILKKYKSEGNLDPYDYGVDEEGNPQFDIDERIASLEEERKTAPEEIVKEEVKPSFGLEYQSDKAAKEVDEDSFYGVAETDHGIYNYSINNGLAPDVVVHIQKRKDDLIEDPQEFADWLEAGDLFDQGEAEPSHISEETAKKFVTISLEDAQKAADEAVGKLGWDWEADSWEYAVFHHGEGGVNESDILDGGYAFHYTRVLDGAHITYTDDYGGGLEDMDSTLTPWSYERCEIIVGDGGIEKVELLNPYAIGEKQTEHVKLMDFASIMKIYEQMMEVSNADITEYEAERTYHIKKIRLGYGRIYDPSADCDTGILVPVWDFFGGFDSDFEGQVSENSGEHSTQSFLTVNAIDGTVIDRGLGY